MTSTSSLGTSFPSPSSSVNSFTSSSNSLHRRWRRSQATSLEHSLIRRSYDDAGAASDPILPSSNKKLPKFGLAILFLLPEDATEVILRLKIYSVIMVLRTSLVLVSSWTIPSKTIIQDVKETMKACITILVKNFYSFI